MAVLFYLMSVKKNQYKELTLQVLKHYWIKLKVNNSYKHLKDLKAEVKFLKKKVKPLQKHYRQLILLPVKKMMMAAKPKTGKMAAKPMMAKAGAKKGMYTK